MLTIRDSRIVENSVEIGGEILCVVGFLTRAAVSVVIDRTSVSDNSPREGHAITISTSAAAIISGSTVSNNRTGGIGGAIAASGDVTIVNSTIANNRAGFSGSAVHAQGTGVQILNSTITNNVLGFLGRSTGVDGPAALRNTIVAGNLDDGEPADCAGIVSLGHNLIGDPGTCTLLASDLSGDPGLAGFVDTGRPGGGVVRLLSDSQAIDAGDDTECPATDQQGLARPIDGDGDGIRACDIGATEFYPVVNDLVELNVGSRYRPPSPRDAANPLTAGGEFRITATLTNLDARDICSVAFEVVTLEGEGSASPLLLTRRGDVIGGEGSIVPATLFNAKPDLDAAKHARYSFRIGLSQMEEITFLVNVLGEVTAGPCVK